MVAENRRVRFMMKIVVITFINILFLSTLYAQEKIVFTGIPSIKISEGGISRVPEELSKEQGIQYKCTITRINDKYYWATRENVEVIPLSGGAYTTFWAVNGSGYVRIVKPEMKQMVREFGSIMKDPEERFDYVEHLLFGLKSVTYWGESK